MAINGIPTINDVNRITTAADAVVRNLQITQCYHELSLGLAERTGEIANWCTFATWASKQAGQTIRKEDLGRSLEAALGSEETALLAAQKVVSAGQRLGAKLQVEDVFRIFWKAYDPQKAFERSSEAVARGNLKVFAEIGREFARFYVECLPDTTFNSENIARFCAQLVPGEPPDGQVYLSRAFQHYYQALFENNLQVRVELMLLANLEIGFHEQTRLQPEINEALTAGVVLPQDFAQSLLYTLHPRDGWLREVIWWVMRLLGRLADFEGAAAAYVTGAQRQAQHLITETMMTIDLPNNNRLRLGENLSAGFPAGLEKLTNPDLLSLLAQIDPTPDSLAESGTQYWGDFADRMHFIADLFRCFLRSTALFTPPFQVEQVTSLKEGQLPAGRL
jgi:hypothetical protein